MSEIKFSKDPKIKEVSIEEFIKNNKYFCNVKKENLWNDKKKPECNKFTINFLQSIL